MEDLGMRQPKTCKESIDMLQGGTSGYKLLTPGTNLCDSDEAWSPRLLQWIRISDHPALSRFNHVPCTEIIRRKDLKRAKRLGMWTDNKGRGEECKHEWFSDEMTMRHCLRCGKQERIAGKTEPRKEA
jgi:hypothetical protein